MLSNSPSAPEVLFIRMQLVIFCEHINIFYHTSGNSGGGEETGFCINKSLIAAHRSTSKKPLFWWWLAQSLEWAYRKGLSPDINEAARERRPAPCLSANRPIATCNQYQWKPRYLFNITALLISGNSGKMPQWIRSSGLILDIAPTTMSTQRWPTPPKVWFGRAGEQTADSLRIWILGPKEDEKNPDALTQPPVTHGENINSSAFWIMKCRACVRASSCPARWDWQPSSLGTALWVSAGLKPGDGYQVAPVGVRWMRARRQAAVWSPPFQPTGSWDKQSCGQRGWIRHKAL